MVAATEYTSSQVPARNFTRSQRPPKFHASHRKTDIKPLLEEYWFDRPEAADEAVRKLLGG